ncbi:MAG: hypothetical protein LBD25_01530 [Coriobacteriales bacterium]|jgi:predicted thioesterase|nr:hypothetical protein [Coriobacteriales bacterium]
MDNKATDPLVGTSKTVTTVVDGSNTAAAVGSGSLDVFSTPMMVALMEQAACMCLVLDEGQTSVGTAVAVEHVAASLPGTTISATATITGVQGRKIEFAVSAHDVMGTIGSGTHARFIVDSAKFIKKAGANRA